MLSNQIQRCHLRMIILGLFLGLFMLVFCGKASATMCAYNAKDCSRVCTPFIVQLVQMTPDTSAAGGCPTVAILSGKCGHQYAWVVLDFWCTRWTGGIGNRTTGNCDPP